MEDDTADTTTPSTFWGQIRDQLRRIRTDKPDTFDGLRSILGDPAYDRITDEVNRNGDRDLAPDQAFFAGSGGDDTLFDALLDAGWMALTFQAQYHYRAKHPGSGEVIDYIEGDLYRVNAG